MRKQKKGEKTFAKVPPPPLLFRRLCLLFPADAILSFSPLSFPSGLRRAWKGVRTKGEEKGFESWLNLKSNAAEKVGKLCYAFGTQLCCSVRRGR